MKDTLAQKLMGLIETLRRKGSTTALLLSPEVASGRARMIVASQDEVEELKERAPKVVTIHNLDKLRSTNGPFVLDNAAVYVVLQEAFATISAAEKRAQVAERELKTHLKTKPKTTRTKKPSPKKVASSKKSKRATVPSRKASPRRTLPDKLPLRKSRPGDKKVIKPMKRVST